MDKSPDALAIGYQVQPSIVAATLLRRAADSPDNRWHALLVEEGEPRRLRVPMGDGDRVLFLFDQDKSTLESPFGSFAVDPSVSVDSEPDPLWESADGICSHMEQDHGDTFELFLRMAGWDRPASPAGRITMPWVEAAGFFLVAEERPFFVPFPQPCPTSNSVRTTLIKMLRGARDE